MTGNKLSIEIKGMHENDEHLLLGEFASELENICTALRHVERVVTKKDTPTVTYRIVNLSHSSPVKISVEAHPIKTEEDYCREVIGRFYDGMDNIAIKGEAPSDFDYYTLDAYKEIGKKIKKGISRLVVSTNGKSCEITEDFQSRVRVIQGHDKTAIGSISGRIEAINFHGNKNEFRIYPAVGPNIVKCHFSRKLLDQAISAVNKYVTVVGRIKYKARTQYPVEIEVDKIKIHERGKDFPKLSDLRGIEPNLTGGLSPEEFVRKMRDEEWE